MKSEAYQTLPVNFKSYKVWKKYTVNILHNDFECETKFWKKGVEWLSWLQALTFKSMVCEHYFWPFERSVFIFDLFVMYSYYMKNNLKTKWACTVFSLLKVTNCLKKDLWSSPMFNSTLNLVWSVRIP